jgi:hypothetical protein
MVTKFSGKFAIIMLKKHRKFCRCGLTHWDATPLFKNRPNTYASPCTVLVKFYITLRQDNTMEPVSNGQPKITQNR